MNAVVIGSPPRPPAGPQRLLAGWFDSGAPAGLAEHLSRHGPLPIPVYRGRGGPQRLIEVVAAAGLRGRGGAGFPTARKLAAVAGGRGRRVVIANGCEGDPASDKDRVLLELAPHLVLDGIELAAHAVGATEAVLCLHEGGRLTRRIEAAIEERGVAVPVRVQEIPPSYVASEESALVNFLNTGDARPTLTPPRPAERGVRGGPTLVDNVETLANLALLARFGSTWFRAAGTASSPGSTLVTIGGAVRRPGVYEVELGTPVGEVLAAAGGAVEAVRGLLFGGLGGSWLDAAAAAPVPLTHEDLRTVGGVLGVAALHVLPARACGLAETARVLRHLATESAGQCGPCMFGLPAIAADLTTLAGGTWAACAALAGLRRRIPVILGRGACAHPDGAVRLAGSALRVFTDDVAAHAAGAPCAAARAAGRLPVPLGDRRAVGVG